MGILLVHLTDLHVHSELDDALLSQMAADVAAAALSPIQNVSTVHVVVSGDIAKTGQIAEFAKAQVLFDKLGQEFIERADIAPRFIACAGNHDCDFSGDQSVRNILLDSMRARPASTTGSVHSQIAAPLAEFRRFQASNEPLISRKSPWHAELISDGIRYVILDSSVMSSKKEIQGSIFVPVPQVDAFDGRTIFVMHHPYSWLQVENARELDSFVAESGDLFLMGHEHIVSAQQVTDLYRDYSSITYLKGHVLLGATQSDSAFQTVLINDQGFSVRAYRRVGEKYEFWPERSRAERVCWPTQKVGRRLALTKAGFSALVSAGANYSHRRKAAVELPDFFVWPRLKVAKLERDSGDIVLDRLTISAEELLSRNASNQIKVITGSEQYGKSALARMLALRLCKLGQHPVFMDASTISSWREKSLNERIEAAIRLSYGEGSVEAYRALEKDEKVLIIDDFDLNQVVQGYFEGFKALRSHFGSIYLMLDSYPGTEMALNEFLRHEMLFDSAVYDILQANYHQRLEIIEKWVAIGAEDGTDDTIKRTSVMLAKHVDETLSRNLIPSVPFFVLIVLQTLELGTDHETILKNGSQGFLYESLIRQAIDAKVSAAKLVTVLNYLSMFAGKLDSAGADVMSETEFERFHVDHCERFDLDISVSLLRDQLIQAGILSGRDGIVAFKYNYHRYYFVATYLAHSVDWVDLEPRVDSMVKTIYTERDANILLFLCHVSRDQRIAEKIVVVAGSMFVKYQEVDLFDKSGPAQKFGVPEIKQVLVQGSRAQELEEHQSDELVADINVVELSRIAEDRLRGKLEDALAMNAAFKTLQVLGQVLRNHSGELEREVKQRMTEACVSLGLRALGFLFDLADKHGGEMIEFRSQQLRAESPSYTDTELAVELHTFLPSLVSSLTVGTLIKISTAIGSEDLAPVMRRVLSESGTREMLHLVTKLEHFVEFPVDELLALKEQFEKDSSFVPLSVLKRFVVRRLLLYPSRDELRRRVLASFKLSPKPFLAMEQRRVARH